MFENIIEIENKWNKKWTDTNLYHFDVNKPNKFYLLEMFSYPSSSKLHLGHWWNYGLSDSFGRFKRLKGFNVFQPMGFDAFGLPAENYAIKTGIHPQDSTLNNIKIMQEQLKKMGATFNWDHQVITCSEDYYKWTQWIFIKLFEKGLAYQKFSPVNWCTSCKTTLANEQVIDGKCERCKCEVIKKDLTQWFFKITDYAERLLEGHAEINWPEKTKLAQKNWIGKSVGTEVDFKLENGENITVFTSRVDTIFGVSWIVLAPEHKFVKSLTTIDNKNKVEDYISETLKKDDIERMACKGEKTGVFTGSYAINPLNNKRVPIYIADYVLASYATGAVMGVAAHDERDYEFATTKVINFEVVIKPLDDDFKLPYTADGILTNSCEFNGLSSAEARQKITEKLITNKCGRFKTNYKLRDWSVSRQRYWGCPIPIIHCDKCGPVAVKESDLPIKLPYNVEWTPDGKSPLSKNEEFTNTVCPICGAKAQRDTDTLDTFVCSTWYQFRYADSQNDKEIFSSELINKICPVDQYVGGMEHATMHLLYARFITKFLYDIGKINFEEPFKNLVHQGMILGTDGQKMSKSLGNTIMADELIEEYGSDCLRCYLMFGFNYMDGGPWNVEGMKNIAKFLERVGKAVDFFGNYEGLSTTDINKDEKQLERVMHNCIKNIEMSFENFSFNTVIARIMELVNAMYQYQLIEIKNKTLMKEVAKNLCILLAPCAPHISEEMWQNLGQPYSVHNQTYPLFDESKSLLDEVEIAVQVRSKIIARIVVSTDISDEKLIEQAKQNEKVTAALAQSFLTSYNKAIIIKSKIINFV